MPPAQRSRIVRRAPLLQRVKAYLDPLDFLLWLSEELSSNELDDFQRQWSIPIGVVLNVIFMLAKANASDSKFSRGDDVFGDYHERRGTGWFTWFASFIVHLLTLLSIINAVYTFWRKRQYRLFETPIDVAPNTPSAHRVRVDSSPLASSPLRYLSNVLANSSAESRAHSDSTRDVWEVAVWDPTHISLRLFGLFSPGHVLIYWLFLPLAPLDPRPSVTVATTIFLAALLSVQLMFLQSFFSQQAKDAALIHGQVQNEYETKFVRPNLYRPVRDVGTQCSSTQTPPPPSSPPEVLTYTPTGYVNRGFQTNPNPNYASHYDPDGFAVPQRVSRAASTPNFHTPLMSRAVGSSPLRPGTAVRQPQFPTSPVSSTKGDGGSFGIYSHAQSPLKKAALLSSASKPRLSAGTGGVRERTPVQQANNPLKRQNTPGGGDVNGNPKLQQRFSQLRGEYRKVG